MAAISKTRAQLSKQTKDDLITQMLALQEATKNAPALDPVAATVVKENATKIREAAKALSVDTIVSNGARFGLEVQRTVASLTEQATQKAEELATLQGAIEVETAELDRLYGVGTAKAAIQALVTEHEAKGEEFDRETAAARAAWDEEAKTHAKFVTQRNQETEAQRRRDEAEYAYRTQQERQKAIDAFNYSSAQRERELTEHVARVNKELDERRASVEAQEKAFADARARIDNIDAEIKSKVDAAVAIATNSVKKDLTAQFTLEKKDLTNALSLEQARSAALEVSTQKMATEVQKLHEQLAAAKDQVTAVTIKALESASGQVALQNVKDMMKDTTVTKAGKA